MKFYPPSISCSSVMSTISSPVQEQKQCVENLLQKLPTMVPCGPSYDTSEGPYFTFNQSWERVFQCVDSEKQYLVVRGKYGLDLVHAYIAHFSKISGIKANNGLHLLHADGTVTEKAKSSQK